MLLVHQVGTLHVGEVVRYKLTYTAAAAETTFPPPPTLSVRVKNNAALPLRAAYLHGPYNLYASCYPAGFNSNQKYNGPGKPQFESNLRAAGTWDATISLDISRAEMPQTWFIEISSQILFSKSAAVSFEVLLGRDEKSVDLGTSGRSADTEVAPGNLKDYVMRDTEVHASGMYQEVFKGVSSPAIRLGVADTTSLWSTPGFPSYFEKSALAFGDDRSVSRSSSSHGNAEDECEAISNRKRKKAHLVIVTHGLHSNIGADMLYLKESIEAAAKQAREKRRSQRNHSAKNSDAGNTNSIPGGVGCSSPNTSTARIPAQMDCRKDERHNHNDLNNDNDDNDDGDDDDDVEEEDEEVIVRGFPGNVIRTERGIQYLGKRLAKYVLLMTYPDQPSPPVPISRRQKAAARSNASSSCNPLSLHDDPHEQDCERQSHLKPQHIRSSYKVTSISFIGHSLGGLIQTYAIAYIQKHSPKFFDFIKPVNFIALASPFLGLSTENPLYVRFALDFGLVGRTGQDLGLSWSAPLKFRNGLNSMIPSLGQDTMDSSKSSAEHNQKTETNPGSKPLLRILPTGLAHEGLSKFQNRTLYSNVVNDGIVPLLTSSLLFLDWKGLGRVEKSSREMGLVGRMAEWGWAELAGINSSRRSTQDSSTTTFVNDGHQIPPSSPVTQETATARDVTSQGKQQEEQITVQRNQTGVTSSTPPRTRASSPSQPAPSSPSLSKAFADFFSFFKPQSKKKKQDKVLKRAQTITIPRSSNDVTDTTEVTIENQAGVRDGSSSRGSSRTESEENSSLPPKTTFFEAAGDILNPPLPSSKFIIDPNQRPETIFHDRIYQPSDIPPPPPVQHRSFLGSYTSNTSSSPISASSVHSFDMNPSSSDGAAQPGPEETNQSSNPNDTFLKPPQPHNNDSHQNQHYFKTTSGMSVEEKIARSYHRGLTWRKVLVRLEPDAHNNIIVRRMFSNAYGWPVIRHLVDTHFGINATTQQQGHYMDNEQAVKAANIPAVKLPLDMATLRPQRERESGIGTVNGLAPPISAKRQSFSGISSSSMPPREQPIRDDHYYGESSFDEIPSTVSQSTGSNPAHSRNGFRRHSSSPLLRQ